ncbi:unnamed protein product [Heligmosomoides polygyrus]|uniref:Uncharacterized protein n=1 Tax=Heligmosomoides polygyrus TaxID=6339 RepID=A0A183FY77_HELPZ|nr:unnamed protein product [Heligmosomoides polygyrus]
MGETSHTVMTFMTEVLPSLQSIAMSSVIASGLRSSLLPSTKRRRLQSGATAVAGDDDKPRRRLNSGAAARGLA